MSLAAAARLLVAILALVLLAACSSKVNRTNFDKINEGMKEDQVKAILGMASESRVSAAKVDDVEYTSTQTKWRGDKGTIVVVFFNGEVQQKIFFEPGTEPPPVPRG
jgi:outer membrane biogenesis lipoprotein LolB